MMEKEIAIFQDFWTSEFRCQQWNYKEFLTCANDK